MADWKIINGNLPFKDDFADRPTEFDGYPDWLWHKTANGLPYKVMFPVIHAIDDAPEAMWKISDDLPYKTSFAAIHRIDDAPNTMWKISDDLPFKSAFPPMYECASESSVYAGNQVVRKFYVGDIAVKAMYFRGKKVYG